MALGQLGQAKPERCSQEQTQELATRPKQGTHTLTAPPLRGRRESAAGARAEAPKGLPNTRLPNQGHATMGRDQGGGLPDVFAGRQGTSKKYGKRVVCDARETAKQYERFQASLKPDIPVKKPHNPNRFDLILFLQRCCSNEELPQLPETPAIRRGLRVLMLELDIPERDLRKMYKYWLEVDRDGSGSVDLFELLMWFDFERTEFMVNTFKQRRGRERRARLRGILCYLYLYCTFTWAGLVKYAFDITDVDRSGFLDMEEVESLCRSVYGFTGKRKGEAFRRKENNLLDLEGTLRQFDSDSDGKISFKEFLEQNRKHKLLLYPAFELQHNMRKAVMGNRYWRNREGPHFTEKDIVLHQLKKAMAPHQEDLSAGHKKLNEDVRRKGGLRASRDEEPQRKKKHPRRYGEKASKFVRTLSGRLKLAGSGPTKLSAASPVSRSAVGT